MDLKNNSASIPDISVVVPYYNQPEDLRRALNDLAAQRGANWEAIVVDDCSDLPCGDVVAYFQSMRLPVRILRQPVRCYTLYARLAGLKIAKGRWLGFLDADDGYCSNHALANAIHMAEKEQCDILHFSTMNKNVDGHLSIRENAAPFSGETLYGQRIFHDWLAMDCKAHSVWNKIYSRRLYEQIGKIEHFLPIKRIEDFYLTTHFLFFAEKYVPAPIPVYKYKPPVGTHLEKLAARGLDAMRMYFNFPERFKSFGLAQEDVRSLRLYLRKLVTLNIGGMVANLRRSGDSWSVDEFDHEALEKILKYGNKRDYALALMICNSINGRKLSAIRHKFI